MAWVFLTSYARFGVVSFGIYVPGSLSKSALQPASRNNKFFPGIRIFLLLLRVYIHTANWVFSTTLTPSFKFIHCNWFYGSKILVLA
jgi:hypothetical protein